MLRDSLNLTYRAYGLTVSSAIALPEFPISIHSAAGPADVSVRFSESGDDADWMDSVRSQSSSWHVLNNEARLWFDGVGGFHIHSGRQIILFPEPGVEQALLRLYVEGMMMACLLHQRGFFVLHASVVRIGEHAIAFLGHVGAGKSSLAAAFHMLGHSVAADDNAAIELGETGTLVTPAFPSVKIFPAVGEALGFDAHSLREMHASQLKRARPVSRGFSAKPIPLERIYVLDREAPEGIARLSGVESTLELIRNSVPTRWRQRGDAAHLMRCGDLSRRIPTWRVRTFHTLQEIPDLARRIEEHDFEHLAAAA